MKTFEVLLKVRTPDGVTVQDVRDKCKQAIQEATLDDPPDDPEMGMELAAVREA